MRKADTGCFRLQAENAALRRLLSIPPASSYSWPNSLQQTGLSPYVPTVPSPNASFSEPVQRSRFGSVPNLPQATESSSSTTMRPTSAGASVSYSAYAAMPKPTGEAVYPSEEISIDTVDWQTAWTELTQQPGYYNCDKVCAMRKSHLHTSSIYFNAIKG